MHEIEGIIRLKRGDIDGMRVLVAVHSLKALRTAYLITGDRHLAEDVVQDAFIRAAKRIGSFDVNRPFGPWFLRIVAREAIDALQRTSPPGEARGTDMDAVLRGLPDLTPGPEEMLELQEVRGEVWTALGELSAKQRAAVVMRYYLDLSEDEMARELNVAPGTVKSRLHVARHRLRALLRPSFFGEVK
jgi:RNA polymerase sigma-70 factor (ECF subfamily)